VPQILGVGSIPKRLKGYPLHVHDHWEVVLYTHGCGIATVGQERISFRPGTIICMPPFLPQVEVAPQGFRNIFLTLREFPRAATRAWVYQDSDAAEFLSTAQRLLREFTLRQRNWEEICEHLVEILLCLLNRWEAVSSPPPLAVERLASLLLGTRYQTEPDLGSAMQGLGYSADHLRKLFQRYYDCSPLEYVTKLRIQEAKTLLLSGRLTSKEIAYQLGFNDPLYFSRKFKKVTGMSPSVFLARSRKGLS
jgi:AraC-like DNA-binding protein